MKSLAFSALARLLPPYALAAATVSLVAALRSALDPVLGTHHPYSLFVFPVLLVASKAGWRPGVFALALGASAANFLFVSPRGSFWVADPENWVGLAIYLLVAGAAVYLAESWRAARHLAAESASAAAREAAAHRDIQQELRRRQERERADEELRQSEERFRSAFDDTNVAMVLTDTGHRFVRVNAAFARLFGYTPEEMLALSMADVTHPDDFAESLSRRDPLASGSADYFQMEKRYLQKGGGVFWGLANVSVVRDARGRPAQYVGQVQDVTHRRRAEEANARSIERLRILHQIDRALIAGEGPAEIAAAALVPLRELLGVQRAIVNLFDLAKGEVEWLAASGRRRVRVGPGVRYSIRLMGDVEALRRGELQLIDVHALPASPEVDALLASEVHVYAVVPMIAGGELIGALSFGGPSVPFSTEQIGIAREAATQFAIAIAHARLLEHVRRQAEELEVRVAQAERAEESLKLFRALIDRTNDSVEVIDPQTGRFLDVNQTACLAHGYTREEYLALRVSDLAPTAASMPWHEVAEGARRTGSRIVEGSHRRKDGSSFPVEVNVNYIRLDRDYMLAVVRDITERKRAGDALKSSETRYRRLFEAAQDGILIVDPQTRRVIDSNPFMTALIGYPREELVGKELWEIGLFREVESNKQAFRALQELGYVRYDDLPLRAKDGRQVEVEFVSNTYDVGGDRVVQCNIRDISRRKRDEEAIRLRDRAIRAATQGLVITDAGRPDDPIIYASPGFERMTGYSSEECLGRNCRFLQGGDTDPGTVARVREAIQSGEPCVVELVNHRKDGNPFWNQLSISPIRDEAGRLTHFVGVLADVTERRHLEDQYRQAQKMEVVGQLAGGVAHDFNNLLTVINGYGELLLGRLPPGDPSRGMIEEMNQAGQRAAGLTRQLLAFSRKAILAPQILDLDAVVADMEKMLRRTIGEDVSLVVELQPGLGRVKADPGQVEQVLMNLCVNARDAMPRGGKLTIETRDVELDETYARTHPEVTPGRYVLLAVSDTGSGMTDEVKARIFEPFFTTKEVGKGTGLGLATVFGIVKQSGGGVEVYSEVGLGTSFKVYLPRVDETAAPRKSSPGLAPAPRGAETVLLVEDEDGVRALARLVLANAGYAVLEAGDGAEALRIAAAHAGPIHLLMSDVVMPELGGPELAGRLVALRPEMKVLFLSGYTDDAIVRHGILQEKVNFLQKPYSIAALAHKVREVLDAGP